MNRNRQSAIATTGRAPVGGGPLDGGPAGEPPSRRPVDGAESARGVHDGAAAERVEGVGGGSGVVKETSADGHGDDGAGGQGEP